MCGICGKYSFQNKQKIPDILLENMCSQIMHRGPDDQGLYVNANFGFGMRRLSIIDVEGGHQPISNENGAIWVICNGEIYNFQELRERLVKKGHFFKTKSDTEVIVHAYEDYGIDCLKYLRGMFAFAVWDEANERLLLARDRLGQKPLYYTVNKGALLFGSEIKAILQDKDVKRQVNLKALDLYLTFQYVPSPLTMFEGIYKLPPAHMLICEKGEIKVDRYWYLDNSFNYKLSEEEISERVSELLNESIKLRMISDVPLGAFLSGGIDSSIVVALMAQHSSSPVKTFSIGFKEKAFSELKYARVIAQMFGTEHHEFIVTPRIVDLIPKLIWHYNEPFGDSSVIPTYYVSEMTRKSVTVALSGDGGDELFAGYWKYPHFEKFISDNNYIRFLKFLTNNLAKRIKFHPLSDKRLLKRLHMSLLTRTMSPEDRNFHMSYFDDYDKSFLLTPDVKNELRNGEARRWYDYILNSSPNDDTIVRILYSDITSYLPDDLLVKVDVASMANSLEVRCPFLDHKLVEFVATLPNHFKLRNGQAKYILKKTFSKLLPEEIQNRPKMGFAIPIDDWFRKDLKDFAYDTLIDDSNEVTEYFDISFIKQILDRHCYDGFNYGSKLWLLVNFILWYGMFIEDYPPVVNGPMQEINRYRGARHL